MGLFCLYVGDLCVKTPKVERGKKCMFTNVNYKCKLRNLIEPPVYIYIYIYMLVDNYIGIACGQVICSSILHYALTLNSIQMRLLFFIFSGILIGITVGLTSGELQNHVKFNSVDSEIFMAMLCGVAGILFLYFSLERDETKDN